MPEEELLRLQDEHEANHEIADNAGNATEERLEVLAALERELDGPAENIECVNAASSLLTIFVHFTD